MRQLFWIPLALSVLIPVSARADEPFDSVLKNLSWRGIGPATMGGRIDDIAAAPGNSSILYVGTASGGIFKSTNNGTTWQSIFDDQPTSTIGDIAIAPSNANIIYVGSGEANNRQSSSWGNGVYKSTDAGKTWAHCGLDETMHIDRIVVDPRNPDVAYVAGLGKLWGPSAERGVFKTTDGGKTWAKSLYVNEDTGCTDIVIDPQSPDTLIAATYQRRRTAFGFNGGGPGSGMYKTTDGGATWKKLSNGLPDGDTGRIGLDIYAKNGKIVMACVENVNSSGVFRSEDGGESWKKLSSTNARPMYYSQIRIDPSNDQHVWMGGVSVYFSSDGGKNFSTSVFRNIHSDFHAIWIDPADGNHVILGCDGGIQATYDGGGNWDVINTFACSQFYEVCFDMRKPYWVYGGLQDNGSWGAPNMKTAATGPLNSDWIRIGGGDGFYAQADPMDSDTVYSESQQGAVSRMNVTTGERKSIRPRPEPGKPAYRFDWNSPILISPHNHNKVLFGGNRLFISYDRGDSWKMTDDLSGKPDRDAMPIMGVKVGPKTLSRHDGQESFGQIVTLTESPVKNGLIYVGTDDGYLQVSKDDGSTWKNVAGNVPGVPKGTYVTRVHASKHAEGRCYASFDGHRSSDFKPYIFVTEDFGETWRPIASGIPDGSTVHVVREHFRNPNLLFAGTERGLYVSFDRGGSWRPMSGGLPMVPVFDLQIHPRENDLILATHGRGIWVLDDITVLEQVASSSPTPGPSPVTTSPMWLFTPRGAVAWRMNDTSWFGGQRGFSTRNPAQGAVIQYWLAKEPGSGETPKITIYEKDGKTVVRELRQPLASAGLNRAAWDLRYAAPTQPAGGGRGAGNVAGAARGGRNRAAGARTIGTDGAADSSAEQGGAGVGGGRGGPGGGGQGAGSGGGRGGGGGGGFGGGGFGARGPRVLPGTYIVKLEQGSEVRSATITVEDDPRIKLKDSERKSIFQTIRKLNAHYAAVSNSRNAAEDLQGQLKALSESDAFKSAPKDTQDAVKAMSDRVKKLVERIQPPRPEAPPAEEGQPRQFQPPPPSTLTSLGRLTATLDSYAEVPSASMRKEADTLSDDARQIVREVNDLTRDLSPLNQKLESAKLKPLKAPAQVQITKGGPWVEMAIAAETSEESEKSDSDSDDESDG